jgi:hypothetical protein
VHGITWGILIGKVINSTPKTRRNEIARKGFLDNGKQNIRANRKNALVI